MFCTFNPPFNTHVHSGREYYVWYEEIWDFGNRRTYSPGHFYDDDASILYVQFLKDHYNTKCVVSTMMDSSGDSVKEYKEQLLQKKMQYDRK